MCGENGGAPFVPVYKRLVQNWTPRNKRYFYQAVVLVLTYVTYTAYHCAKRPVSVVKGELAPNCTKYPNPNKTCPAWAPFDTKNSIDMFGLLDCAFLMSYALSMFVSGYIAEHTNLRIYLSVGMVLTGLLTCMFGMAFYWRIHQISYFFLVQILTGITQSTGWPCVVEAVGTWFPEGRRGLVMGLWNTHVSVGNIVGSAIAGAFVNNAWGLSFIIPGLLIAGLGIIVYIFLVPDPGFVGMDDNKRHRAASTNHKTPYRRQHLVSPDPMRRNDFDGDDEYDDGYEQSRVEESQPIGLWGALRIPGVIEYSLCLFFAKLVSYTFLFWLPFYITNIKIGGKHYGNDDAADWAILFDVGGAFGGIMAGFLVDRTKCPGLINVTMLVLAAPCLFLFKFHGTSQLACFISYMMLSGFFVNGPYALITTAVSASLGTHDCLRGNTKAMAVVTSIIDATGSLGAAVGPLLAGIISSSSWDDVFYMLIACDVIAALLLSRQVVSEVNMIRAKIIRRDNFNVEEVEPLVSG